MLALAGPAALHLQRASLRGRLAALAQTLCSLCPALPCVAMRAADQLNLLARLPVTNPNYLAATLEGDMYVLFYEAVAGRGTVERRRLPPRAAPKDVDV